jgi:secreted PhoX family phosphatase
MTLSRRHFLRTAAAFSAGFAGLHLWGGCTSAPPSPLYERLGPLVPDPQGVIDLAAGFVYKVISRKGERMDDGFLVPGMHDGMAAFARADGKTVLVRNHELTSDVGGAGPFGEQDKQLAALPADRIYDAKNDDSYCLGGTSTLVYDTRKGQLEKHFLSLVGTVRNCAGGPTPWNSWISCEETVQLATDAFNREHGYNFEVPAAATGLVQPVPLRAMGRFNHEAVAVDPQSGIVYQTEDRNDSSIYRFIPHQPGKLSQGGRLQALQIRQQRSLDMRNWEADQTIPVGTVLDVEWVDIDNTAAPLDDLRFQGFAKGTARFARGEGMWYGQGSIFFGCTSGGQARAGQVWRYTPSPHEGTADEAKQPARLQLFVEPNDQGLVDNADNLTVTPWGDLILCEDGGGEQFLVGVTPQGQIYKLGRNARSTSEFAGATFSPDGTTLFVNIQRDGLTLAITGPWTKRS